ncbi:MAG: penicillin-binding protein 1C [Deltaproteobacteria bacterium]|nr:penicillin-binding protein 1C [Deltaproteobacteria bacterium]
MVVVLTGAWILATRQDSGGHVPSFDAVHGAYTPSDARLVDRHGQTLYELRVDRRQRRLDWTALADISPALQSAVIASEDRRFYRHHGVDYLAFGGALRALLSGARRGASTITMQVAAQVDPSLQRLSAHRTWAQKWRQFRLAQRIERSWSKPQLLEAYLNLVSFRGELQGVRAAAMMTFGKQPHGLNDSEALILAALLRAPSADAQATLQRAQRLAKVSGRANEGLDLETTIKALEHPRGTYAGRAQLAPHVARRLLGDSDTRHPVVTTLDADIQGASLRALQHNLLELHGRRVEDGAVLVVQNDTGNVLAYVGSSEQLSHARYVDAVRARRQAGSSLKPFLYGLAFEERLLAPSSLLEDTPLEIAVANGLYRPQNYDDQFHGLVSVRTALASSINIPAVRTLLLVGADAFIQRLRDLGFAGIVHSGDYYGPSLALGSADVSLWELVNAYRTLARGGRINALRLRPDDPPETSTQVFSDSTTFLIASILADRESRSATFGFESPLTTPYWTAVKTGTSKEMRDNWCIGFSSRYTVGVWVGNASGAPMQDVTGVSGAAPVWREVMDSLHREEPSLAPKPPTASGSSTALAHPDPDTVATEMKAPTSSPILSTANPRISVPTSGTLHAIDPDLPPGNQRIAFEARESRPGLRWVLDGSDFAPAQQIALWPPQPGAHTLQLIDEDRRVLDQSKFTVRGGYRTSTRQ